MRFDQADVNWDKDARHKRAASLVFKSSVGHDEPTDQRPFRLTKGRLRRPRLPPAKVGFNENMDSKIKLLRRTGVSVPDFKKTIANPSHREYVHNVNFDLDQNKINKQI